MEEGLHGAPRDSAGSGATEEGLTSSAELGQESQASSCVEEFNSSCLSSCSRGDRPLVELCVEPAVFSRQCTAESQTFGNVKSSGP